MGAGQWMLAPDVVDGVVLYYLQHFSTRLTSEQYLQTIWPLSINQ